MAAGSSNEEFCGSLRVNSAMLNGHFSFHWDEALGRMKSVNGARYLITSWNEIPQRRAPCCRGRVALWGVFPRSPARLKVGRGVLTATPEVARTRFYQQATPTELIPPTLISRSTTKNPPADSSLF
jgi:hypothetical protein